MKKIWFAHRGYHQKFVENSFAAFKSAYENDFSGVELDLRLTNNGEIVVFHDESTGRLSKWDLTIAETPLEQLKKISIYKKSSFFWNRNKQKILTLKEFLTNFYDRFLYIDLELKDDTHPFLLEKKLLSDLATCPDFRKKIIVTSFNLTSLRNLHTLDQTVTLGLLIDQIEDLNLDIDSLRNVCKFLCVRGKVFGDNLEFFRKINFPIITWNVKQKKQCQQWSDDELVFGQIMDKKLFSKLI